MYLCICAVLQYLSLWVSVCCFKWCYTSLMASSECHNMMTQNCISAWQTVSFCHPHAVWWAVVLCSMEVASLVVTSKSSTCSVILTCVPIFLFWNWCIPLLFEERGGIPCSSCYNASMRHTMVYSCFFICKVFVMYIYGDIDCLALHTLCPLVFCTCEIFTFIAQPVNLCRLTCTQHWTRRYYICLSVAPVIWLLWSMWPSFF